MGYYNENVRRADYMWRRKHVHLATDTDGIWMSYGELRGAVHFNGLEGQSVLNKIRRQMLI